MDRRKFLVSSAIAGTGSMLIPSCLGRANQSNPTFLSGYKELYASNPRKATIEWFRNARYGMFIHYGLYSLLN